MIYLIKYVFSTKHRLTQEQAQRFWQQGGEFGPAPGKHTYRFETSLTVHDHQGMLQIVDLAGILLRQLVGDSLIDDISQIDIRKEPRS